MNHSTRVIAASALALLAAACSGSLSSPGSGSSPGAGGSGNPQRASSQLLAFAQCMRSHGLPSFPDPASDDKLPDAHHLGVSDSRYQRAMTACRHLLPSGGSGPDRSQLQQQLTAMLPFSRCMRSHGYPTGPTPPFTPTPLVSRPWFLMSSAEMASTAAVSIRYRSRAWSGSVITCCLPVSSISVS